MEEIIKNEFNAEHVKTITTLEIAEMLETPHYEILKKLEGTKNPDGRVKQIGIIPTLNNGKIPVVDYFIKSSYVDAKGEERPCYNVTKLGCDFLANKFTGEKGILFTAKYVKRFHEMDDYIKENKNNFLVSFREQVQSLEVITEMLHMNEASKLLMLEKFYNQYNIPTSFLPKYEHNNNRQLKALSTLLKENSCGVSAVKFNKKLLERGYIEERERPSSKGSVKKFKALTESGLKYEENAVNPHNQKEVQPLYYSDTFMELYKKAM